MSNKQELNIEDTDHKLRAGEQVQERVQAELRELLRAVLRVYRN